MITYKFFIRDAEKPVLHLRLTNNRRVAAVSLGVAMTAETLCDALSAKPARANQKWSVMIRSLQAKLDGIICDLIQQGRGNIDVKEFKNIVLEVCLNREVQPQRPAGGFVKHYIKFMESKKAEGTKEVYRNTLNRMRLFDAQVDTKTFEQIDLNWLKAFEEFCSKTSNRNTCSIHLRNIRAVFNSAIDYELTAAYPFRRYKIRGEATPKRAMTVEELRKLFSYPVESYAEVYRDMFKLIFFLIGINTVDLHRLKEVEKGRITYKRAKTGRMYSIKVEPEAMEIIDKYRGKTGLLCIADRWSDHRNFRRQLNKAIQRVGIVERKGRGGKKYITSAFPNETSYSARHSWATIAYELGISKDIIGQALGHADNDHSTTNIYIREDEKFVDEANRRVMDWVLYGKR